MLFNCFEANVNSQAIALRQNIGSTIEKEWLSNIPFIDDSIFFTKINGGINCKSIGNCKTSITM